MFGILDLDHGVDGSVVAALIQTECTGGDEYAWWRQCQYTGADCSGDNADSSGYC